MRTNHYFSLFSKYKFSRKFLDTISAVCHDFLDVGKITPGGTVNMTLEMYKYQEQNNPYIKVEKDGAHA